MRYFCWNCKNFMSESDIDWKWYHENRGEFWGMPAYEDICEDRCPFCGSESIGEAECERCGHKEFWDEDFHFEDGTLLCRKCWEEDQEEEE